MRVFLGQINPTIGAVDFNLDLIQKSVQDAHQQGAALAIFPELALCGYIPKDGLFQANLMPQVQQALETLARTAPIPVLVGAPVPNTSGVGQFFWNAAVCCYQGDVKVVAKKKLLPNYNVFDERRYFEPGDPQEISGLLKIQTTTFGVTLCEDAWNDEQFFKHRLYDSNPVADVVKAGADVLVNIAASPFSVSKPALRESIFVHHAKRHAKPFLVVGQVGANDQLVFDGGTAVFDSTGKVVARAKSFETDSLCVDISSLPAKLSQPLSAELSLVSSAIALGIADYVEKCQAKGVLIGLSGGVDSAVVATLAVRALGAERVMGVRMPSRFSSKHSWEDAEALAQNLGIVLHTLPIESMVEGVRQSLTEHCDVFAPHRSEIADQNLQARMRGVSLMAMSNVSGHLVLATGNKSELAVGYSTLYGDMCGALMPIGDVYKTQVWELARFLNSEKVMIPERTISKSPSAELKENQSDQDTLLPYGTLDKILRCYIDQQMSVEQIQQETGVGVDDIREVVRLIHASEHKRRQAPIILMVSDRVFGDARRMVVASKLIS